MLTAITENPRRELQQTINGILNLATTEKKNHHLWNVLQFLYQDMLILTREEEKEKNITGDLIGAPTNAAGGKKATRD